MITENAIVQSLEQLDNNIYLLKVKSPEIAEQCYPGQFCNIKVSEGNFPLLRRPFSICDADGEFVWFMFEIVGEGTEILAKVKEGDVLNIIGPLGNGFELEGDYDTAVIVGGGLGIAPFPFVTANIDDNKEIISFLGGRTKHHVTTYGLENIYIATDDGSDGIKGNVLDLIKKNENLFEGKKIRIFSCGPNPMLKAVQDYANEKKYDCQLSTECAMACGFGICMGCVTESEETPDNFKLVCVDGPVFDARDIKL